MVPVSPKSDSLKANASVRSMVRLFRALGVGDPGDPDGSGPLGLLLRGGDKASHLTGTAEAQRQRKARLRKGRDIDVASAPGIGLRIALLAKSVRGTPPERDVGLIRPAVRAADAADDALEYVVQWCDGQNAPDAALAIRIFYHEISELNDARKKRRTVRHADADDGARCLAEIVERYRHELVWDRGDHLLSAKLAIRDRAPTSGLPETALEALVPEARARALLALSSVDGLPDGELEQWLAELVPKVTAALPVIRLVLSDVSCRRGNYESARELLNFMDEGHHPALPAARLVRRAGIERELGQYDAAHETLRQALDTCPTEAWSELAGVVWLERGIIERRSGRLGNAREYYLRGLAVLQRVGAEARVAAAHRLLGNLLREDASLTESLHHFEASRALYSPPGARAIGAHNRAAVLCRMGWLDEAEDGFLNAIDAFTRLDRPELEFKARSARAGVLITRGSWTDAEAEIMAALSLAVSPRTQCSPLTNLVDLHLRRGRLSAAERNLRRLRQATAERPGRFAQIALGLEGVLAWAFGDAAAAKPLLAKACDGPDEPWLPVWWDALAGIAAGEGDYSRALANQLNAVRNAHRDRGWLPWYEAGLAMACIRAGDVGAARAARREVEVEDVPQPARIRWGLVDTALLISDDKVHDATRQVTHLDGLCRDLGCTRDAWLMREVARLQMECVRAGKQAPSP